MWSLSAYGRHNSAIRITQDPRLWHTEHLLLYELEICPLDKTVCKLSSEIEALLRISKFKVAFNYTWLKPVILLVITENLCHLLGKCEIWTGLSQAIFTAECSHSFHFSCIANRVKHGHHHCPICHSKWKDLPFQFPTSNSGPQPNVASRARAHPLEDYGIHSPPPTFLHQPEPIHFSDDEPLPVIIADATSSSPPDHTQSVTLKAFPEFPAVGSSESVSKFAVLVGVRAPPLLDDAHNLERAPIDLVTVLDVSGSMDGSKLLHLKHAVWFVIQNLGPSDRLAIVVFSSNARRIFPFTGCLKEAVKMLYLP